MKLSFLGNGQLHTANTTSEDAVLEQNLKNGMEKVSGKLPGETVTGTVVEKNGNEILLSIGKNQLLQAKLDGNIPVDIGRQFTFTVKSASGSRLHLSPLFMNMANDANVSRALNMAGIPETDASISMVNVMMKEGMPIDKDSLQQMMRSIHLNSGTNVETLVQMTRLQIPLTENNIVQFEAYKNYEHQISDGLMAIADSLSETMKQCNLSGNKIEGIALYHEIFSLLSEGLQPEEGINIAAKTIDWNMIMGADTESISLNNNGDMVDRNQALINTSNMTDDNSNAYSFEKLGLSETEFHTLAEHFKKAGFSELSDAMLFGKVNRQTIMAELGSMLDRNSISSEYTEQIGKLLESPELNKSIKQEMKNQWMLSPEEVAEENKVEELYQRLNQHLNRLSNVIEQNAAQSPFAKAVNTLSGNIDFMNQLNQMFTYVQIPLKLQGQEASGELYVYTNKKNLANENGEVSALLHLDMEHLGSVNVHVSMKEQKVSTKFYLEDESALDFIAEHIDTLNERLNKRGYQMNASFIYQDEEKTNIMDEILQKDKNISVLSG